MKTLGISSMLMAVAFLLTITSCGDENNTNVVSGTPIVLSRSEAETMKNVESFSLDFFEEACNEYDKNAVSNFVVSPVSAAMSMGLVANACDAEAQAEILNAFGLTGEDISLFNTLLSRLCKELPGSVSSESKLTFANSIWVDSKFKCNESYFEQMETLFDAKAQQIDFTSSSAVKTINEWCSKKPKEFMIMCLVVCQISLVVYRL